MFETKQKHYLANEWSGMFEKFNSLVANHCYKKIEYNLWKKLNKIQTHVLLFWENEDVHVCPENFNERFSFYIYDGSFGTFLYNRLMETKGENKITCINSDPIKEEKELILNSVGVEALKSSDYVVDCVIASTNSVEERICDIEKAIDKLKPKPEKEDKNMKNFNFDFGPCTNDQCHVSMYGIAVKNAAGVYVSYNPDTKEIVDVDILNFEGAKYMYKIPVALNDVAVGDVIIHNRRPMFVIGLSTDGSNSLTCVDVCAGEQKTIVPTVNMFGFNFITKIVSLFNMMGNGTPSPEHPFGNMLPFMLMGDKKDIDPMMLMMMMNGNTAMNNPMMLYFMFKDNKDIDPMMLMLMFNNTQPHVCNCANSKG